MKPVLGMGLLALFLGLSGSASSGDPFADQPRDAADLVQRLATAHARQDIVAMLNLFDWRGLDGRTRHGIEDMVARDLGNQLIEVDVVDAPGEGMPEAVGSRPNRTVTHLVIAVYDAASGRRYVSLHQVGVADGVALIALPVSVAY